MPWSGRGPLARTRPLYSRGDLVILFLSLGLGGARTGDCSLRLGRLLLDGRLVVFRATGQPQEAKAQQSKAQSTGEQPHDEYDSPRKWARRRLKWRKRDQESITRSARLTRACSRMLRKAMPAPTPQVGFRRPGLRVGPPRRSCGAIDSCYLSRARAARLSASSGTSRSTSRCQARASSNRPICSLSPASRW